MQLDLDLTLLSNYRRGFPLQVSIASRTVPTITRRQIKHLRFRANTAVKSESKIILRSVYLYYSTKHLNEAIIRNGCSTVREKPDASKQAPNSQEDHRVITNFEGPLLTLISSHHFDECGQNANKKTQNPIPQSEKWGSLSASLWCSLLFIQIGHVHQ